MYRGCGPDQFMMDSGDKMWMSGGEKGASLGPPWGVDTSVDVLTLKDENERAYKGILLWSLQSLLFIPIGIG